MVGNLTVGKERYRNVEEEARQKLVQLERIRERLANLVRADEEAFAPLAAACFACFTISAALYSQSAT